METEEPVTSLGSSSEVSLTKLLDKLPSADSEALCQFFNSGRMEDYIHINGEELLMCNEGQVAGATSDLVFDGLCRTRRFSKPSSGLLFRNSGQTPLIENSSTTYVYPEMAPPKIVHQMDCPTESSSLCQDFENTKDRSSIEHQSVNPDETTHKNMELGNIERLDNTSDDVATGYRKHTKMSSINTLCKQFSSSKLNDNQRDKIIRFQMATEESTVPTRAPSRTSEKLVLNETNIVEKTQIALNNLVKIKKIKKIKEKFLQKCLIHLFSYTVEESEDSVLHVLATSNESPVPIQATKIINLLKVFNVIDSLINIRNNKNETPLLVAAARGTPYMVTQFLEAGADANASDIGGNTALHLAVLRDANNMEIVDALLASYPDLTKYNEDGYTALHLAVSRRKSDLISAFLIKSEDDVSREDTEDDVARGEAYTEELINKQDRKRGNTALHIAVENRFKEVVKLLLNFDDKIEIDATNFDGKTPLAFLMRERDPVSKEIAELLLANKADPTLVDIERSTTDECKREIEPELEIIDIVESLDEVSAFAREWGDNNVLFDKATISKLCQLLDKGDNWIKLFKRLKYSNSEIDYCKIHWSPTLSAFKIAELNKPEVTAEIVRDELMIMSPHLRCGAKYIDDMFLKRLGVD